MDAVAAPGGVALDPGYISLSALSPGAAGVIVSVGSRSERLTALDRRLLEFGFCSGEQVEIIAETRPGRSKGNRDRAPAERSGGSARSKHPQ